MIRSTTMSIRHLKIVYLSYWIVEIELHVD